jgi:hypothetical protein
MRARVPDYDAETVSRQFAHQNGHPYGVFVFLKPPADAVSGYDAVTREANPAEPSPLKLVGDRIQESAWLSGRSTQRDARNDADP